MPKTVTFIVPSTENREEWIAKMPELNLLGSLCIQSIQWKEYQTGTDQDWAAIAQNLVGNWEKSNGFVIWAPEQSILGLAGYLSMIFQQAGKPIILFSAPAIDNLSEEAFEKLELKSVLINAAYLAQSDLAEVLILSGQHIYRPAGSHWSTDTGRPVIRSLTEPLAHLDYALSIHKPHEQRHQELLHIKIPQRLLQDLSIIHWMPGFEQSVQPSKGTKAVLVQLDAHNWKHPQLQAFRKDLQATNLPTIWYSKQEWGKGDLPGSELAITHPQFWWVLLATQVSFGLDKESDKAIERVQNYLKQSL